MECVTCDLSTTTDWLRLVSPVVGCCKGGGRQASENTKVSLVLHDTPGATVQWLPFLPDLEAGGGGSNASNDALMTPLSRSTLYTVDAIQCGKAKGREANYE